MTYECQYFVINSSISECYQICETQMAEPEIGTDTSSQTRWNTRGDGYGSSLGLPTVCWLGIGMGQELNRPVYAVQSRTACGLPGPVVNTFCYISRPVNFSDFFLGFWGNSLSNGSSIGLAEFPSRDGYFWIGYEVPDYFLVGVGSKFQNESWTKRRKDTYSCQAISQWHHCGIANSRSLHLQ